ncbi:MAG: hypothetical protein PHP56_05045 [Smithellaceae bacterium]|jgi:hypothetical protein|nr:hypothetical protein [Smithellaceae bacterium]
MTIPVASIFSGKFEFDLALPAAFHNPFSSISNLRLHILNILSNEPETKNCPRSKFN